MCRTHCAERRWDMGDSLGVRCESIGPETLPGRLALPDPDDPEPLVGRARGVQHEPIRGRPVQSLGEGAVLLPAGGDVLDDHVRHVPSLGRAGVEPV